MVLALSHCALTAGLQEAFLETFVFLQNCFLAGGLLPALNLSFLKQISAVSRLGFNQMESFIVEGGNFMIFRDYFLTQNREQIKKYEEIA